MTRKIRVLHILWSGGIGGAEELMTSVIKYIDSSKFEISVCFLSERGDIYNEISRKGESQLECIEFCNGFDIRGAFRLLKYLKKNKFDIVHCHERNFLSMFILSLFFRRTRKLITHHAGMTTMTDPGDIRMHKKNRLFYLLFSGAFSKIIAISIYVKDNLIRNIIIKHPDKIAVLYNGIDMHKFNGTSKISPELQQIRDSSAKIIGFVGRMVPFKRAPLFVKCASEIVKRDNSFKFIMVGDGPEMEKCRDLIGQYKLNHCFKLLGLRRDIPDILRLLDALLFTSEGEGFGIVIIEAMASGVPVFAINEGGVNEIITDNENGILLNTVEPAKIAKQILDVFTNEELINKIRKRAVQTIQSSFSAESVIRQLESIYEEVLSVS